MSLEFKNGYGQSFSYKGNFIENVLLPLKYVLFLVSKKLRHFQIIPLLSLLKFSSSV